MAYGKVSMFEENSLVTSYVQILICVPIMKNYTYYSYLSSVNATIVKMDTEVTSSDVTIAISHPHSPKGIG